MRNASTLLFVIMASIATAQLNWSTPAAISVSADNDSYHDTTPRMALEPSGKLGLGFIRQARAGTTTTAVRISDVYFSSSADAGSQWAPAQKLSSSSHYNSELNFSAGSAGEFLLAWNSGDLFSTYRLHLATTIDAGNTLTTQTVTDPFTTQEMGFVSPKVAKAGGNTVLTKASWNSDVVLTPEISYLWSRSSDTSPWAQTSVVDVETTERDHKGTLPRDLETEGNNCVAVYLRAYSDMNHNLRERIAIMTSSDAGLSWTSRGYVAGDAIYAGEAVVESLSNGNWVLAWLEPDRSPLTVERLFVQRSNDDGATWSFPLTINPVAETVNVIDSLSIASNGAGQLLIVFRGERKTYATGYGEDGDILYTYSLDNGITWSTVAVVNDSPESDAIIDAAPQAVYLGNGNWGVAWSRTEPGKDSVLVMATAPTAAAATDDWHLY